MIDIGIKNQEHYSSSLFQEEVGGNASWSTPLVIERVQTDDPIILEDLMALNIL